MKSPPIRFEHRFPNGSYAMVTIPVVDIAELFRHDPIGLEKYQERIRGIEARLGRVLEKSQ